MSFTYGDLNRVTMGYNPTKAFWEPCLGPRLSCVAASDQGQKPTALAGNLDGSTVQSTPESGMRAGYDGCKRRTGFKVRIAVDTLGYLTGNCAN
jgi:hypothetical protein